MTSPRIHPRDALLDAGEAAVLLPVCDHYAGVEVRMRKSLELQAELGPVFDVTLDCEDGAPIGGEAEHAQLVAELAMSALNRHGRVGARVHPVDHASFEQEVETLISRAGSRLAYLMVPKPRHLADVQRAADAIDHVIRVHGQGQRVPLHFLVETHGALRDVDAIAAHPRVESLSFGLMDFVSAHRGAIPAQGMSVRGQFSHPLVLRAKLEIAAACHAHGKTPSHSVVTELNDRQAIAEAAEKACRELGYTRMWSIHPNQIRPIVEAFAPTAAEVDLAVEIVTAAQSADWAPIRHRDVLHDRASYRYFWQVLERAHRTRQPLPAEVRLAFFEPDLA
ncbi:HpcH/HpaI aldolase/citrate lyase family protein [Piscinibacter sp.]|uniref:HpcH/HpaI aldolase/citrate lyase family protein n=1 Tax=Piscinibacter sp. TaxID=1903157 RepID=UPI002CB78503|nr:aldolase/citrate lyase family protein [Albitalea sp.]HUG23292.1 aldolase/citrate lyase family protein [Albitalea sp.]